MEMSRKDIYVLALHIGKLAFERSWFKELELSVVSILTPQPILQIDLDTFSDKYFFKAADYFFEVNGKIPSERQTGEVLINWFIDCILKDCFESIFEKGKFKLRFRQKYDFFGERRNVTISYLVENDNASFEKYEN